MDLFSQVPQGFLSFDQQGLLPHIIFNQDNSIRFSSPFEISLKTFESLFSTTPQRKLLADNLLTLVDDLSDNDIIITRIYIGGSYISNTPAPNDLDILICWRPDKKLKNKKEVQEFITGKLNLFDKDSIMKTYRIQVHFHGLIGSPDKAVNLVSKWTMLNSYCREFNHHRGIISLAQDALQK
jgi:predicted nucleotidyltransferase